jgi:hypothetical protein
MNTPRTRRMLRVVRDLLRDHTPPYECVSTAAGMERVRLRMLRLEAYLIRRLSR